MLCKELELCVAFFWKLRRVLSSGRFRDPRSHCCHQAQVGFQVCVRPGSYKVGPQSLGNSEPLDPRFSNSEIEWITKEQGGTLLYGLLIRIEWTGGIWVAVHSAPPGTFNRLKTKSNPCLEGETHLESSWARLWIVDNLAFFFLFFFMWSFSDSCYGRELQRFQRTHTQTHTHTACTLCFGHSWESPLL